MRTSGRREFLVRCSMAALGAAVGGCRFGGEVSPPRPRKIVLVVLDALRARSLPCYGNSRNTAPFLTRLTTGATVFDRCVAVAPWTRPSVASILTGLMPEEHGQFRFDTLLDPSTPTIASALGASGYTTGFFPVNGVIGPSFGMEAHFDHVSYAAIDAKDDPLAIRQSVEWAATLGPDARLFVYLHLYRPHMPYDPPAEFVEAMRREAAAHPIARSHLPAHQREVDIAASSYNILGRIPLSESLVAHSTDPVEYQLLYEANVRYADSLLERLFELWRSAMGEVDTCFLITADHGESFGEGGLFCGHGRLLSETLLHVPLIVVNGPELPAGRVAWPVSHLDLGNTILRWAGIDGSLGAVGGGLHDEKRAASRLLVSSERPGGLGVPSTGEPSWAVTRWPWRLVYNDVPHLAGHCLLDVLGSLEPGGGHSARGALPETCLRRACDLAPGVHLEQLGIHARAVEIGVPHAFSGALRRDPGSSTGTLTLRFRTGAAEALPDLEIVCESSRVEIEGVLPPIRPASDGGARVVVDAAWMAEGSGQERVWERLWSFVAQPARRIGSIELVSASVLPSILRPGGVVLAKLLWRSLEPSEAPEMELHLVDAQERIVAREVHRPLRELLQDLPAGVGPDDVLHERHRFKEFFWLLVPAELEPGRCSLVLRAGGAAARIATLQVVETARAALGAALDAEVDLLHLDCLWPQSSDLPQELAAELSARFRRHGHFKYLEALSSSSVESRPSRLAECLELTPFHRRALLEASVPADDPRAQRLDSLRPRITTDLSFANVLRLFGYDLLRDERRQDVLYLRLFWESLAPTRDQYAVAGWYGEGNELVWLLGGLGRTTDTLAVGESLVETVLLPLPVRLDSMTAAGLLERASRRVDRVPARPEWKRVDAPAGGRDLHLLAWQEPNVQPTRVTVELGPGRWRMTARGKLRSDCVASSLLEVREHRGNRERTIASFEFVPGRERGVSSSFVLEQGGPLSLVYRMAPGAATHENSNLLLRDFRIDGGAGSIPATTSITLQLFPYWHYAYHGWVGERRSVPVLLGRGAWGTAAELGSFIVRDLPASPVDWIEKKRSSTPSYRLYDLREQVAIARDHARDEPRVFEQLRRDLDRLRELAARSGPNAAASPNAAATQHLDPEEVRELRGLGYLR